MLTEPQVLLSLGFLLFLIGLAIVVTVANFIHIILGLELMLNATNINLVAFNKLWPFNVDGQVFVILVLIIAVCETSIGLALVYNYYKWNKKTID